MSEHTSNSDDPVTNSLQRSRDLLSASAIRALAQDGWARLRWWVDGPALVGFVVIMIALLGPFSGGVRPIPPLDSIAPSTIRAERDILVEDQRASQLRRDEAAAAVWPAFDYDSNLYFELGRPVRTAIDAMVVRRDTGALARAKRRQAFQDDLGVPVGAATFALIEKLERPEDISAAITFFFNTVLNRLVIDKRAALPRKGGINVRDLATGEVRGLPDTREVLDLAQVRRMMRARAGDAPYGTARIVRTWVLESALSLIKPNMKANPLLTDALRKRASEAVEPVFVKISSGEVVIREGDRVTRAVQERLRYLNQGAHRRSPWSEVAAFGALLATFMVLGGLFFRRSGAAAALPGRKAAYIVLTVVLITTVLSMLAFYAGRNLAEGVAIERQIAANLAPVALATLLLVHLIDGRTSFIVGVVLSVLIALRVSGDVGQVAYYLVGVLVAGVAARRCRRRADLLKAGIAVALAQMAMAPLVTVLSGGFGGGEGLRAGLLMVAFAGGSGLLAAVCATGLMTLLEYVFDETTDMRLLELASADNALLKELALKCPGTYYHSMVIANLAEAAGDEIGANGLQCRVMALYHDIGKTVRPAYFAENQRGGNIHDRLPPELSARIIFAHIKDGIDIARRHRLGRPILDAITQHQGTTLLRVFFARAQEIARASGRKANEAEFRYPGPRPRNREAGILLLADAVEAATRALDNPQPDEVRARIDGVVEEKINDGQLDECDLTLKDIAAVRGAFQRVLTLGVYHSRIDYPPVAPAAGGGENGRKDRGHRAIHTLPGMAERHS
jgi:putative nucleotidyltransferase with HDIG domain